MFQIVHLPERAADDAYAAGVRDLVIGQPGSPVTIASEFRPASNAFYRALPDSKWTRIVRPLKADGSFRFASGSPQANGRAMADEIAATLLGQRGPIPARVMVDELSMKTKPHIAACASRMAELQAASPQLQSRWGVFLVTGRNVNYRAFESQLRLVMATRGIVAVEMYASYTDFCRGGGDAYLRRFFFTGEPGRFTSGGRFAYIYTLAGEFQNPPQPLTVVFGVADPYLRGPYPKFFIDRMMFVWMQNPRYRGVIATQNGGAGSWKWEWRQTDTFRVGSSTRDSAFAAAWRWYGAGNVARRPGVRPVICP
jgi:hypothetical protein